MSLGEMLQQMNADTINLFAPYTTNYKWERYSQAVGISQDETQNTLSIMATTNPATIQYCTSFTAVNGVAQMNNPTSITWPTTTTIPANVYVYAPAISGYIRTSTQQTISKSSSYLQIYGSQCTVQVMRISRTWVTSSNISTYPADGYQGNYYYKRITVDNMWNFYPEVVTYVGTGVSTSSNPVSITFKMLPKAIRWLNNAGDADKDTVYSISIYNNQNYGAWLCTKDMSNYTWYNFVTYWNNSANVGIHVRTNGNSIQFYVDSNAGQQALSFAKGIWNVLAIY